MIFDDFFSIKPIIRLVFQFFISGLMIAMSGEYISNIGNLLGTGDINLGILSIPFTIFCVVGITNAFNWIDGIDGFFSFQVLLALVGLIIIGRGGFTLAHLSLLAALLPYSIMNLGLLGKKFKVFIGDHGAMMIGFFLACSFIFLTQETRTYDERTRRGDQHITLSERGKIIILVWTT